MRSLVRWSMVVAFCAAILFAAVQPAWHHASARRLTDTTSQGGDAPGAPSGLKSQTTPQEGSYIGPGTPIAGPTVIKAVVSSPSSVSWNSPNLVTSSSSHALRASRLSPHLRSIPLLI